MTETTSLIYENVFSKLTEKLFSLLKLEPRLTLYKQIFSTFAIKFVEIILYVLKLTLKETVVSTIEKTLLGSSASYLYRETHKNIFGFNLSTLLDARR